MSELRNKLTELVNKADEVLEDLVINWVQYSEIFADNDRIIFLSSQSVEMATYHTCMMRATRGLGVYLTENDSEIAKNDLYEASKLIDEMHAKAPNDRTSIANEILSKSMFALQEKDIEQLRELLTNIFSIADTSRLSVLDHIAALRQELNGENPILH